MIKWLFKRSSPIIEFKSIVGEYQVATPIIPASKCKPKWMKEQRTDKRFQSCPGMLDYSQSGYIITAHTSIRIKANSAGVVVITDVTKETGEMLTYRPFDYDIVAGIANISPNIKKTAGKVPLPWAIKTKKGYSAYVLPAQMHSSFLDKLFVYPGVVDYDNGFFTVNFVFSPIVECEFTIDAGEPLLQIIPFKREPVHASCTRGSDLYRKEALYALPPGIKQFYRRFISERKKFTMECPYKNRLHEKGD